MKYLIVGLMVVVSAVASSAPKVPKPPNPWLCWVFQNCIPDNPGWVPEFDDNPPAMVLSPFTGATQPANRWYFCTKATAEETCKRLGCAGVYERKPCQLGGGPNTCNKVEWTLKFFAGDKNAGFLAAYWERNPEGWFPGAALKLAQVDMLK